MPFLLYAQHKKLVVGKKSGLVELSRASRFSRSLARLASGKFQLVSSPGLGILLRKSGGSTAYPRNLDNMILICGC